MSGAELRTAYSKAAHDLALAFVRALGDRRLGPAGYVPKITEVETDSTAGGATAKQAIRLVSQASGMPPLLVGHANVKDGTAEIRELDFLSAIHRERYDDAPPIPPEVYRGFLDELEPFLEAQGLRTKRLVLAAGAPATEPTRARSGTLTGFVLGLLVAAIAVAVWLVLRR